MIELNLEFYLQDVVRAVELHNRQICPQKETIQQKNRRAVFDMVRKGFKTINEISDITGINRTTVRDHCRALERDNLVACIKKCVMNSNIGGSIVLEFSPCAK